MNRILHFGPGNFFRAHLADYTHELGDWSITAVSLRSSTVRDGLAKQGYSYTLDRQRLGLRRINCIDNIIVNNESPDQVLSLVQEPHFSVISATVTEKGYSLKPNGRLNLAAPEIAHDLTSETPSSFIGILAKGLATRTSPVTVLSCDNRNGNGDALARAVTDFQRAADLNMACDVSFPNTMVDRITPATASEVIQKTNDQMAVSCEPFKEWVVEDRFVSLRPNWPGVRWVKDVSPYELRKLRLLNGAHSFLAYAGTLAGYDYVHEAIGDPRLRTTARSLMNEAAETLPRNIQSDSDDYTESLISRFDNKDVKHQLRQIATDGSQKVPYRLIESIRNRQSRGLESPALLSAVIAWIGFVQAETCAGRLLNDPLAVELAEAAISRSPTDRILALIDASDVKIRISE